MKFMKKKVIFGIIVLVILLLAMGIIYTIDMNRIKHNKAVLFSTWGYDYCPPVNLDGEQINKLIHDYIIFNNEIESSGHQGRKWFASIKTYLIEEKDAENTIVYAWVLDESCYKQNDEIVIDSGFSIPYKFILQKNEGNYKVIDYQIPRDGTYYSEDMKAMFPEDVLNNMNKIYDDGTMDDLKADIEKQKNEYFSKNIVDNDNPNFFGKVVESSSSYIIVEPNENEEERKSSDKFSISLGENNDMIYEVGTNVKITYTGFIRETYPAQIDVTNIEIKSADNFELKFYDKKPKTDSKINKILDKSETDKYNYNIYAYEGSVNIIINGKEISLKNALLESKITMEEIIAKANKDFPNVPTYDDGGSIEYHYENYTIIKCHTLDGNRDVYIGTPNMTINDVV